MSSDLRHIIDTLRTFINNNYDNTRSIDFTKFSILSNLLSSPERIKKFRTELENENPDNDEKFSSALQFLKNFSYNSGWTKPTFIFFVERNEPQMIVYLTEILLLIYNSKFNFDGMTDLLSSFSSLKFDNSKLYDLGSASIEIYPLDNKLNEKEIEARLTLRNQQEALEKQFRPVILILTKKLERVLHSLISKFKFQKLIIDDYYLKESVLRSSVKYSNLMEPTIHKMAQVNDELSNVEALKLDEPVVVVDNREARLESFVKLSTADQYSYLEGMRRFDSSAFFLCSLFPELESYVEDNFGLVPITVFRLLKLLPPVEVSRACGQWLMSKKQLTLESALKSVQGSLTTNLIYSGSGSIVETKALLTAILQNQTNTNYKFRVSKDLLPLLPSYVLLDHESGLTAYEVDYLINTRKLMKLSDFDLVFPYFDKPQFKFGSLISGLKEDIYQVEGLFKEKSLNYFNINNLDAYPVSQPYLFMKNTKGLYDLPSGNDVRYLMELSCESAKCVFSWIGPFLSGSTMSNFLLLFPSLNYTDQVSKLFYISGFCRVPMSSSESSNLRVFFESTMKAKPKLNLKLVTTSSYLSRFTTTFRYLQDRYSIEKMSKFPVIISGRGTFKSSMIGMIKHFLDKAECFESDDVLDHPSVDLYGHIRRNLEDVDVSKHLLSSVCLQLDRHVYQPIIEQMVETCKRDDWSSKYDYIFCHNVSEAVGFFPMRAAVGLSRPMTSRLVSTIRHIIRGDDVTFSNVVSDLFASTTMISTEIPPIMICMIILSRHDISESQMLEFVAKEILTTDE